jgi:hypothetical protein
LLEACMQEVAVCIFLLQVCQQEVAV